MELTLILIENSPEAQLTGSLTNQEYKLSILSPLSHHSSPQYQVNLLNSYP